MVDTVGMAADTASETEDTTGDAAGVAAAGARDVQPPAETVRRPALSPSRAGDFKQCPLLYRFRAIDRIPEKPSKAQLRGIVVHSVLEQLFSLPAAERVPQRAYELVEPAWSRIREERPELAELFESS